MISKEGPFDLCFFEFGRVKTTEIRSVLVVDPRGNYSCPGDVGRVLLDPFEWLVHVMPHKWNTTHFALVTFQFAQQFRSGLHFWKSSSSFRKLQLENLLVDLVQIEVAIIDTFFGKKWSRIVPIKGCFSPNCFWKNWDFKGTRQLLFISIYCIVSFMAGFLSEDRFPFEL